MGFVIQLCFRLNLFLNSCLMMWWISIASSSCWSECWKILDWERFLGPKTCVYDLFWTCVISVAVFELGTKHSALVGLTERFHFLLWKIYPLGIVLNVDQGYVLILASFFYTYPANFWFWGWNILVFFRTFILMRDTWNSQVVSGLLADSLRFNYRIWFAFKD